MKKIGIFYGSTTGTTKEVAEKIAKALGVAPEDVNNVDGTAPSKVADYDVLVLGSSTWGSGELQDNWYDFIEGIESLYLGGKDIAIFGCGDENMADTFCNAVGIIYNRLQSTGANFIGAYNTAGYDFSESEAVKDGVAVGLLIDNTNHPDLTDKKVNEWCAEIKSQI
ncbi:MAG: flavodoxin [Paramuribaculum sp.]|nr:flavodoxin [Paramuribaculum sp.]